MSKKSKKGPYQNVQEFVRDMFPKGEAKKVEKFISERSLANFLCFLRNKSGLTEQELAKKIGVSTGEVERLESAPDAEISICDLAKFSMGLGLNLQINVGKMQKLNLAEKIDYHLRAVIELSKKLSALCKEDQMMLRGAAEVLLGGTTSLVNETKTIVEKLKFTEAEKDSERVSETFEVCESFEKNPTLC